MYNSILLDAPAGKHGFAKVRDGPFHIGGRRVRFYGFNIAFKNLFSPKKDTEIIAERLSKAGVNFVRIHAPDCIRMAAVNSLLKEIPHLLLRVRVRCTMNW